MAAPYKPVVGTNAIVLPDELTKPVRRFIISFSWVRGSDEVKDSNKELRYYPCSSQM